MTEMKGITCCGDCAYYNFKQHKCVRYGVDNYGGGKFYDDCPLPDVIEPKLGMWKGISADEIFGGGSYAIAGYMCSICGFDILVHEADIYNFCPNCGADMRGN